ncbi:MAG TPA: class I SAM-dependent methyltransferase [Longimicrobium sp.]
MAQYDTIAREYQEIAGLLPIREPEWYSLRHRLGDVTGLSVLDLACGNGLVTRLLKHWGAGHVVGVDVSAEMVGLARRQEEAQPLGIEYHVADVAALGRIGSFDRVTAAYLLNYARSREELLGMARTIYDNLEPGQHFVTGNANPLLPAQPTRDLSKYGVRHDLVGETLHEGSTLHATLFLGDRTVEFDFSWLPWEAYEEAFRTVGFRSWKIEPYLIPPELEEKYGKGFWDDYIATPAVLNIICQK